MKAAESREGKRSLSTCDDDESGAKRNKKQIPKITGNKDVYCWTCHKPGNVATCSECPRAYHLKCGHLDGVPKPSEKWICPECDTVQRADKLAPSSSAHKATLSKLLGFVLDRVKRVDGVDNFSTPVDTNKWHDYLDYVIQPMDLPKLKSNVDDQKYLSVESFLADFRCLVHASYVYNSVHSVYTKIAKSMMNVAKQECEEVKNCSECYMHACTLGDSWFIEPCSTPHVLVWAQLSGFPYWPAKVMRHLSGDLIDVRFFGDHTRANVPAASCFMYSRVMPCSVKSKKHSSKITSGIEEAENYVKNLKSTYKAFCYAQYRVNYLPKEEDCMRKLQLPEFPIRNATPEFLAKVESLRKEKMLEDKKFHSEMKQIISEQEKSKPQSLPQKRKSLDGGSKLLEMRRKLVKIDTPRGQKFAIMNMSGSESDSSPKHSPRLNSCLKSEPKNSISGVDGPVGMNGGTNKTPSKVDDETIKEVLARSPKESDKISPKSLSPPSDSGIIESLSRKLFTTPKNLLKGEEDRGPLARALSQGRNNGKCESPLESDSDSDALVIAEESSPSGSPAKKAKLPSNERKSLRLKFGSPSRAVNFYPKTQHPEKKKQLILVRRSCIPSEKLSPANSAMSALTVASEGAAAAPAAGRKTVIVHRSLPPTVSEMMETRAAPLVSRRTRSSMNVDATSGTMKTPLDAYLLSGDLSSAEREKAKTALNLPLKAEPVQPVVNSRSVESVSSRLDEEKSVPAVANRRSKRLSKEAFEPNRQAENSGEPAPPADCAVNSQSTDDVATAAKKVESVSEHTCKASSAQPNQTREQSPEPSEAPKTESHLSQAETGTPCTDVPADDVGSDPSTPLAAEKARRSSATSDDAPRDPQPPQVGGEPAQSTTESLSIERTSSSAVEQDGSHPPETGDERITDSNVVAVSTLSLGSKDFESTSSATLDVPGSTSDLSNAECKPENPKLLSPENKEQLDLPNSLHSGNDLEKAPPLTQESSLPTDFVDKPNEEDVQTITLTKSIIRHSSDDSPTLVDSPECSSVMSSPEKSVIDAVRKMPASMEVPVIKVVRAQHATSTKELDQPLCGPDAESSSASIPVEDANQADTSNVDCKGDGADMVLHQSSGGRIRSPVSTSAAEDREEENSVCQESVVPEGGGSKMEVEDTKAKTKTLPSLDMLDGDLSHLYQDLEPAEEDDESDEPLISEDAVAPDSEEAASSKEEDEPVAIPGSDKSREEAPPSGDLPESQALQNTSLAGALTRDDPVPIELLEKSDAGEVTVPESKESPPEDFAKPVDESPPTETEAAEESPSVCAKENKLVPATSSGEKDDGVIDEERQKTEPQKKEENVPSDKSVSDSCGGETPMSQPSTGSPEVSSTSELESAEPPGTVLESQPPPEPGSSSDVPNTPEKPTEPGVPHAPQESDGKCTCVMCHTAHPGASFDKTVEDYQLLKSIELDEPKRGLPKETEEFFRRLRETDGYIETQDSLEDGEIPNPGSSRNRRKSLVLEQNPLVVSTFKPRKSTDSVENGPSTSSGKTSRPLPGLVTLQRRSSIDQNSQAEKSPFGGLQIASSMTLNPSALQQMAANKSPVDQSFSDARKTPVAGNATAAASSGGSSSGADAKKSQTPTTMPLPIIIKPDPDAEEVPEVPKAQSPPAPPKPTIKLKQMSSLLERPPPPPSPKRPEVSNSKLRNCTTPKFNMVPPFEPKKTLADVRKLIESKSQFISAKLKKDIYTLFDQIQHEYDSHMELLEHIADASLNTVESTLETNKNLVFEEMKIRLKNQVDAHIADVKKKQWCILCGNEAAFHCCWGYNYCCEDCQKNDWAEHTKVCTQYSMSATDPYIRASPRFQALLEKQMLSGGNKKIMVQDLIDSPVAISAPSGAPGKGKPAPPKSRKILGGPRTSLLDSELPESDSPNVSSTASAPTITSYKIVQPGRTVRIINSTKPRPPQIQALPKTQLPSKAAPRPIVTRAPVSVNTPIQRKQVMTGRIVSAPQTTNRQSFLRVMDDKEIASILQRNHLNDY